MPILNRSMLEVILFSMAKYISTNKNKNNIERPTSKISKILGFDQFRIEFGKQTYIPELAWTRTEKLGRVP
jgi:hypothetical protein